MRLLLFLLCTLPFLDIISDGADTTGMSDEGFMYRRLDRRKKIISPNTELAEAIAKIRAESETPPPLPRADVTPPPIPRKKIEKGITDHDRERARDAWHREAERDALVARARAHALRARYVPPVLPNAPHHQPPPLKGWEERMELEKTSFKQTEVDLNATFKKVFMPKPLSAEELRANEAARLAAHKFAARKEPERAEPQSDMIKRLDAWIRKEKELAPRRKLEERLLRNFPAMKAEITGFADATSRALEQLGEEIARDARRHGLERRQKFSRAWFGERYDAMNRARIAKFMIPLTMGIGRIANSPKLRYAIPAAAFLGALAGVSSALNEHGDVFSHLHAHADSLPSFAPDSIADVSIPHPTEPVPVANTEGSPNITMLNGDSPGATVEGPVIEAGEAKPNEPLEEAGIVVEPIEVKGDVSVWSSLLDGLGEKGIDLSEKGEQAFAEAVQHAIEDTGTQSAFIEYKGEGLTDVAWDKIPDGATIHFDLLFGNQEFLDRLKELLESSEYKSLGKELRSFGGADGFISDVQDAFGVQYL